MSQLPGSLGLASNFPFVGRVGELQRLRALIPEAAGEAGRVALLGGEPGSGKSRLVREFAAEVAADGGLVLYGACDAVVHTPYGPFVEALDQLGRVSEPAELREALGIGGGELKRLLPDLQARVGELPDPVPADPDTERHRLHTAVTDLLAGISRHRPVLLLLEDGHWADVPTLLLLRHLARAPRDARLLLLATFRDTETDLPETLSEALADLRRSDEVVRLHLDGLTDGEVADFVRHAAQGGRGAGVDQLATAISNLTAGNPFLVCELWRAMVETGFVEIAGGTIQLQQPLSELGTPESVREVVSQRLSRLGAITTQLLELAATAGAEFELDPLRQASGLGERELLGALEEAAGSGMIEELPALRLAYRFSHELVRRALYDRLSRARRAELHLRVGEALEDLATSEGRGGRALAELAHHFAIAAPFGGAERGIDYNVRAARAAIEALAFDQAAERLRTALELPIEGEPRRAEILLELGTASHKAGRALDALDAFRSAAGIARSIGDQTLFARGAIGFEEACWRPGMTDEGAVELLEEATEALGEQNPELRVGLLGGLARALDFQGQHERGATVRRSAVGMAREVGDQNGLAQVLARSYWSRGTSSLEEILEMLTEAKALGKKLSNTEICAEAMAWRVPAFVALCDIDAARTELAELLQTAEQTAQPFMLHVAEHYGSAIALADGNLAEAEKMAGRSRERSQLLTGRDASGVHGIQMFNLRREQGRLTELAPVIRVLASKARTGGPWGPGLVSLLVELGMEEQAQQELSRIAREGLDDYRESLWLASLTYLTDACAVLGDQTTAALVYPALEPHAGTNVMIGHLVAYQGAADRYLGMLAATLGAWQRAEEHFERAMELNRRMGASTWLAHTAYEYARLLLRRPEDDGGQAAELLGQATRLAQRIGMPTLLGRIGSLESVAPRAMLPDDLSPREAQILVLVARGLSNREIGEQLVISEHTAANHIRSILRKTGCTNRTGAASYAHRHGLAGS
ncbi:MAG: ATP-binding protein [Solirubrobacterales bacterium]